MPYKKGESGNPAGRPKGSKNKVTLDMKERIQALIDRLEVTIDADIEALEPGERIKAYLSLLEYVTPKLSRASVEASTFGGGIQIPQWRWDDDPA